MLQKDGVEMVVVMVLVVEMVMMMILMKSSLMAVTMATISPSGREFPRQIPACRRAFLSSWFSASQRRRNIWLDPPPDLSGPGRRDPRRRSARRATGRPDGPQARPAWGPRLGLVCAHGG